MKRKILRIVGWIIGAIFLASGILTFAIGGVIQGLFQFIVGIVILGVMWSGLKKKPEPPSEE